MASPSRTTHSCSSARCWWRSWLSRPSWPSRACSGSPFRRASAAVGRFASLPRTPDTLGRRRNEFVTGAIYLTSERHSPTATLRHYRRASLRHTPPHRKEDPMRRFRMLALGASVLALVVSACSTGGGSSPSASTAKAKVIVGSANFPESILVGEIYAQALEAKGFSVDRKLNIGARSLTNAALKSGQINLMPEYIGSDAAELKATPSGDPQKTWDALKAALDPLGMTVLNFAPGADQNGFAVRKETADKFTLKTMSDAAAVADRLKW